MATLILDFVPPEISDYTTLQVWESATKEGAPGSQVATFPVTFPYPTRITVTTATSGTDWFSIRWAGANNLLSEFSQPIKGGTSTLIGTLINRVMLRQPNADENVVKQVAEAVVEQYLGISDVYGIDPTTLSYTQLEGLTQFIMAYTLMNEMSSTASASSGSGWTAGLVSMKATSDSAVKVSWDTVDRLLDSAKLLLGLGGFSRIANMEICIAGGMSEIVTADISRLLIEVE